ncbi:MAG TPA: hypothetical protein P5318_18780 [Candidatus Hydrogenedentes bacterium]|nr:hypothetical protein [Candidatus Hydrogenedentota bacterium]HPC16869.1 hypothetical protein [Candidatus Hydrogenedentota bacterium]HRT22153.1 hypothetical protein [Candidatus Hydrogenedentota bacterium]HRT22160.1 hypothetical protein [Candidatus Hydrogenedentota bacterium]HRT66994.1 hypothetical protein [Candidatus Hydrogenedentota bacterium]
MPGWESNGRSADGRGNTAQSGWQSVPNACFWQSWMPKNGADVAAVQEFLAAKYASDCERFNLKKYRQTWKEGTAKKWAK